MIKPGLTYRFEFYLITASLVLFGSLIFPKEAFDDWMSSLFLNLNIIAGFLIIARRQRTFWYYSAFFAFGIILYLVKIADSEGIGNSLELTRLAFYSVFYTIVTLEIIVQIWKVPKVGRSVILGLICGYISLGLVAFFLVMAIEISEPGSFSGLPQELIRSDKSDALLYYAYITLMTIGYGDMVPLTQIAQKGAILIGLSGQFYLVIITAVVVGKYIATRKNLEIADTPDTSDSPDNPDASVSPDAQKSPNA